MFARQRAVVAEGKSAQARLQRVLQQSADNLGGVLVELAPRAAARKPLRSVQAALLRAADAVGADNPAAVAAALDAAVLWWRRACELAPRARDSAGAAETAVRWEQWAAGLRRMDAERRTLRGRLRALWAGLRGGAAVDAAAARLLGEDSAGR